MKTILIHNYPPEEVPSVIMDNPDTDEEDHLLALPFCRWNCCNMIIDPTAIIYWLNCILSQNVVDLNLTFCIYEDHGWNLWKICTRIPNKS